MSSSRLLISELAMMESYTKLKIEDLMQFRKEKKAYPASFEREIDVWKLPQQKQFINWILNGYPLPNLTAINTDNAELEWVDGIQRESTIIQFVMNKIRIHSPKDKALHNKLFKQLPKHLQEKILKYPIVVKEFLLSKEDPDYEINRTAIREFYIAMNSKGVPLNSQEVRMAIYEFSQFLKATKIQNKKMQPFYKFHKMMKGNMIQRSQDKELTGEFMVLVTEGANSSGKKLSQFHETWSKIYPKRKDAIAKLDHIILRCIPKLLGKNKLSDIGMNTFADLYAIVGLCANLDQAGIETPSDSFTRLKNFKEEVKKVGKRIDDAKTSNEKTTMENTNAGKYWKSSRDATRSKTNREKRIKALGKALIP